MEEEMQLEIAEEENPENGASELSDDDLAASLGFMTTLTEGAMPQDPMAGVEEEDTEEAPGEEASEETKDADQDKAIQDIEAELARIEAMLNNGTTPENTGTEA